MGDCVPLSDSRKRQMLLDLEPWHVNILNSGSCFMISNEKQFHSIASLSQCSYPIQNLPVSARLLYVPDVSLTTGNQGYQ